MFDITTSRDFLAKLEADFADFERDSGSSRLALNCAISAYHLADWVWADWLKSDVGLCTQLGIKDRNGFLAWIDKCCPWFPAVHELTTGAKHFQNKRSFKSMRVSMLPFAFDLPDAGFDESHWDGPQPFLTGTTSFLLIDFGPKAAEHRWMLATMLLEVVVRFWREFFTLYAPKT
jgi:hypothetical protein